MGKRSDFVRRPQDAYDTPYEAVIPLLHHLDPRTVFCEPCAGNGQLIDHLTSAGHRCYRAFDTHPRRDDVQLGNALRKPKRVAFDCYITNPPWTRAVLHPMIEALSDEAPTWLLFDAAWAYTKQAKVFRRRLKAIVPVGRVRWIVGTRGKGKDDSAWYLFGRPSPVIAQFYL